MGKEGVFISHWEREHEVAKLIGEQIRQAFGINVFVAEIDRGDDWEGKITTALMGCRIMLILLSKEALARTWLHWEYGVAYGRENVRMFPCLHRGLEAEQLPRPFSRKPTHVDRQSDLGELFSKLASRLECNPRQNIDFGTIASHIRRAGNKVSIDLRRDTHRLPAIVRIPDNDLYRSDENKIEIRDSVVSVFGSPHLHQVFQTLMSDGQPQAKIISLDEFWTVPLAIKKRLRPLQDQHEVFLKALDQSCIYKGKRYSVPTLLDFSFYAALDDGSTKTTLKKVLGSPITKDNIEVRKKAIDKVLKNGKEAILSYNHHEPDTIVSVVLEFIEAFGAGINSLETHLAGNNKSNNKNQSKNILALRFFKHCVGEIRRDEMRLGDFRQPSAMLDSLISRHWYGGILQSPEILNNRTPLISTNDRKDFPLKGTLGGWQLGLLTSDPVTAETMSTLNGYNTLSSQQKRFENMAGLPTLREFFDNGIYGTQVDPVTECRLNEIGGYVSTSTIRRSTISDFHKMAGAIVSLHHDLFQHKDNKIGELYRGWCDEYRL